MNVRLPFLVFFLAWATAACSSPKIGYDYDSNANFQAYHTYEWLTNQQEETGDKRLDNSLLDTRLRTVIGAQLRSKGYRAPADHNPDFFVTYHIFLKDMMKGSSTQNYIGDRAHGTYTTLSDIQPYKEGTLLIDIIDAASKQLVWRATALAEVNPGMTPEERNTVIGHVVRAMFTHFPPK